jgi:TPR repeat protein
MAHKKATEDMFNQLHNLVTEELLNRIKSGEATTQDLKAACDWLTKNDISGIA